MFQTPQPLYTTPNSHIAQAITESASDIHQIQEANKLSLQEMLNEIDEAVAIIGTEIPSYIQNLNLNNNNKNDSSYSSSDIEILWNLYSVNQYSSFLLINIIIS